MKRVKQGRSLTKTCILLHGQLSNVSTLCKVQSRPVCAAPGRPPQLNCAYTLAAQIDAHTSDAKGTAVLKDI